MSDADNTAEQPQSEAPEAQGEQPIPEDHLGDAGKRALAAERDARKAAERQLSEATARLKEIEDANLSEIEKAKRDAEEARTQLAALQRESARARVALEKGVPSDLIEFISGDDEEQMAAKADLLMSRLNSTPSTPKPDFTQGAAPAPSRPTAPGIDTFAAGVKF